jgi:hypothetical protein
MDINDVVYPRTINEDHIACGLTPATLTTWAMLRLPCSVAVLLRSIWRKRQQQLVNYKLYVVLVFVICDHM